MDLWCRESLLNQGPAFDAEGRDQFQTSREPPFPPNTVELSYTYYKQKQPKIKVGDGKRGPGDLPPMVPLDFSITYLTESIDVPSSREPIELPAHRLLPYS